MSGKGVLRNLRDGGTFDGEFVKGKKNGYGIFTNSYGSYEGNFRLNIGTFRDDKLNG